MYSKPYLPVADQIKLLKSRGMMITNDAIASEYLHRIGYYRLSAYWHPMRVRDAENGQVLDDFVSGTTFKQATDLYTFDGRLRLVMLDALERLEVALRTDVALQLGKHDSKAHRNLSFLGNQFSKPKKPGGPTKHKLWLQKLDEAFIDSKDRFAEHFRTNYPGDDMPIWIAVELLDFGPLSHLVGGLKYTDAEDIGKNYGGILPKQLTSWAHSLSYTRNICAHHSRLWNKPLINQPATQGSDVPSILRHINSSPGGNTRFYSVASIARFLLSHANPRSSWKERFVAHMKTFPETDTLSLSAAGFPEKWEEQPIWI